MTDMQRYDIYSDVEDRCVFPAPEGQYVLASDAEAAIAAAEQHAIKCAEIADRHGYERGQRDMLAHCIAAVEGLLARPYGENRKAGVSDALAALRALGGSDE